MVFWRKKTYDRSAILDAADRARGRGRVRNAIAGYSQFLAQDPDDHQVHARIAPLLALTKKWNESLRRFDAAGVGLMKAGFVLRGSFQASQLSPLASPIRFEVLWVVSKKVRSVWK